MLAFLGGLSINAATAAMVDYNIVNSEADLESFNITYNSGSGQNTTINGALAGGIQISEVAGGTQSAGLPTSYTTVCTDLGDSVYLGSTYGYDVDTFAGRTGNDPLWGADVYSHTLTSQQLLGEQAEAIQNAAYIFYNYGYGGLPGGPAGSSYLTGTSAEKMAAVQLAIWCAIYNTGLNGSVSVNLTGTAGNYGLTSGRVDISNGDSQAIYDAYQMLQNLTGSYGLTGNLLFPDPNNTQGNPNGEGVQELMMQSQYGSPVPEPTTVLAGAALLLPFGISTLRCLRRSRLA